MTKMLDIVCQRKVQFLIRSLMVTSVVNCALCQLMHSWQHCDMVTHCDMVFILVKMAEHVTIVFHHISHFTLSDILVFLPEHKFWLGRHRYNLHDVDLCGIFCGVISLKCFCDCNSRQLVLLIYWTWSPQQSVFTRKITLVWLSTMMRKSQFLWSKTDHRILSVF